MLQGEDVVRHSGVPFAVVRPCALTEEPAGAELQLSQGDDIKVDNMLTSFIPQQTELLADALSPGVQNQVPCTVWLACPVTCHS